MTYNPSGGGGGGGVTDHGALTGLADNDHAQYLNTTRGDARYYTQSQSDSAYAAIENSGYLASGTIDFGSVSGGEMDTATTTLAASWVNSGSAIACFISPESTTEHDIDDCIIEDITVSANNILNGVSFDVTAVARNGTFGSYKVKCVGVKA